MKREFFALLFCGSMLLTGCAKSSTVSTETSARSSNSSVISNELNEITNDTRVSEFEQNCSTATKLYQEYLLTGTGAEISESSAKYDCGSDCLYKIYVVDCGEESSDGKGVWAFFDINTNDEYQYFVAVKDFANYIVENVVDISGDDNYIISVNAGEYMLADLQIIGWDSNVNIIYGSRELKSAYSQRLKNMDAFKDCEERYTLSGLRRYDDLPSNTQSREISVEYESKKLVHKWYEITDADNSLAFVTYIDDGTYDNVSDDELIAFLYGSISEHQSEMDSVKQTSFYFYITDKSGTIDICTVFYYSSFSGFSNVYWSGDYSHLNDNSLNISMFQALKGE